ncbi:hypothetical protein SAMN04490243_2438 [Robiginitalea myxolifaciens]|uniref:Uncharacterized protein n=1 Tax=Robiginitalea myxolifaciens TaxID=400055 RepID=A0A1I6H984_9FLAO|nr:hypothetical protein [Robiginitalea myxolifaciens]SFR51012.1 hypothetical protein SAMN04490243_2438 [Robiginitalea myxolifaciens]
MKYFLKGLFVFILCGIGQSLSAQESIIFEAGLRPKMVYKTKQQLITQNLLQYRGDSLMLANLEQAGIENPQESVDTITNSSLTYTGNAQGANYPLQMKITESDNYDLPAGALLFGEVQRGIPVFDSIANSNMDEATATAVLKGVSALIKNTQVPPTALKVGESFSHSVPMEIPIGPSVFVVDIVTEYTLIDVQNGIANLNLDQVIVMNTTIEGYEMTANGTGKGTATYSVGSRFLTGMNLELDMTLEMEIQGISIRVGMKSKSRQELELLEAADFPEGLINLEN